MSNRVIDEIDIFKIFIKSLSWQMTDYVLSSMTYLTK